MTFALAARVCALVCSALFVIFAFFPAYYAPVYGVDADEAVQFMTRRASPLFLGFSVLLWAAAKAAHTPLRDAIALGGALMFMGIAVSGCLAFAQGVASPTILLAAAFECLAAIVLWAVRKN